VVIELSPPEVVVKPAAEHECFFKRCCHWCKHPVYVQPVAPMAVAPMAVAPMAVAPMAVQSAVPSYSVAPAATSFAVQPAAVQSFAVQPAAVQSYAVQPAAVQSFAVQPAATSFAVQSLSLAPAAATSMAVQPLSLSIAPQAVTTPQALTLTIPATPSAATAEATRGTSGMDVNQALRRLSVQIETLTKVVERHGDLLTDHEKRLQDLEKPKKAEPIKLPKDKDKEASPGETLR
jgi:hypothetical protein